MSGRGRIVFHGLYERNEPATPDDRRIGGLGRRLSQYLH